MNKKFNIKNLPNIQKYTFKKSYDEIINIKKNYNTLITESYKIINFCIENNIYKPTIFYNLFFCIELNLKYYLLCFSNLEINFIEKYSHNIIELLKVTKEYDLHTDKLKFLLQKFKDKNNNNLNFSKYYHYKYNKEIGIQPLIFNYSINEKEKDYIKEVMQWLILNI